MASSFRIRQQNFVEMQKNLDAVNSVLKSSIRLRGKKQNQCSIDEHKKDSIMWIYFVSFAVGKYAAKMMPLLKTSVKNKNVQSLVRIIELGENWNALDNVNFDCRFCRIRWWWNAVMACIHPLFSCHLFSTARSVIWIFPQTKWPYKFMRESSTEYVWLHAPHIKMSTTRERRSNKKKKNGRERREEMLLQFTMYARNQKAMQFPKTSLFPFVF